MEIRLLALHKMLHGIKTEIIFPSFFLFLVGRFWMLSATYHKFFSTYFKFSGDPEPSGPVRTKIVSIIYNKLYVFLIDPQDNLIPSLVLLWSAVGCGSSKACHTVLQPTKGQWVKRLSNPHYDLWNKDLQLLNVYMHVCCGQLVKNSKLGKLEYASSVGVEAVCPIRPQFKWWIMLFTE